MKKTITYLFLGELFAVEASTGTRLANFEIGENVNRRPPAVSNGVVYVMTTDRSLFAVDMQPEGK